ncbi:hypothetical protein [Schauerella aestuarii]|uniref:hypothetical protein n=1 Tax=Schauerella aestuarii TaxID=2511204 RepID=UPI0013694309|nr:hypothetical protein [Achromobacter aestuarii]MYZ41538.1 hypothetical protein [Achromobacter aestuarii]
MASKGMMGLGTVAVILAVAAGGVYWYMNGSASRDAARDAQLASLRAPLVAALSRSDRPAPQFRNERIVGGYLCGEVAGVNEAGATGAFEPFAVSPAGVAYMAGGASATAPAAAADVKAYNVKAQYVEIWGRTKADYLRTEILEPHCKK